jgi:hypothetical protein
LIERSLSATSRAPGRIRILAQFLADRTKEKYAWAKNMILLGGFNIFDTSDQTINAILEAGFTISEELQGRPSNAPKTRHYDQIAFIAPKLENHLKLSEAWVFDYYEYVYREEDEPLNVEDMGEAYLRKNDGRRAPSRGEQATTKPTGGLTRCPTICQYG